MIKTDDEEIWYWYEKIKEFHDSGMAQKEYCDNYQVDYKKFCNLRYRIEYKKLSHPELYAKMVPIARKYMQSGATASKFAKAHEVEVRLLSEFVTHLSYLDIIDRLKSEKESKMKFVQIQHNAPIQQHEVLEKQNDLEIIITKGVKVSISPNIDSMKIIKIIELLKDL